MKTALEELENLELPSSCPIVRTGSGGVHAYLAYPTDFEVKSTSKKLRGTLDTRGAGGYVLLPPSRNAQGPYEWERLLNGNPPELPKAIADELPRQEFVGENKPAESIPDSIPDGKRNDTLFRSGCSMRRKGFSEEAICAALLVENKRRCNPPLEDSEVRTIARSAARYPAEKGPIPPP